MGRLLSTADAACEVSRSERLKADAAELDSKTAFENFFQTSFVNVFLKRFGVKLISTDGSEHVSHVYEEWPGMDRRRISGSVYRDTKLFFLHGGTGAAWLDPGPLGTVLRRQCRLQAADRGAPVALARQGARQSRSFLIEQSTEYPGAAIGLGGATPQELKLLTTSQGKLNAARMALRDNDLVWLRECRAYERQELRLNVLVGPRTTAHQAYVHQVLTSPGKKLIDIGSRGPAGDCFRLDPSNWIVESQNGPRGCPVVVPLEAKRPPIGIISIGVHSDDTPQKLIAEFMRTRCGNGSSDIAGEYLLWRDRLPAQRLPRWYVHKKIFVHETTKQADIDKSNLFDLIQDAGSVMNTRSEVWDNPNAKPKLVRNGLAARTLRRELKAQGIKAQVVEVPERTTFRIPDQAGTGPTSAP
jgi:hypothetical protein